MKPGRFPVAANAAGDRKGEQAMSMPDTVRLRLTGDRPALHRGAEVAECARRATLGRARLLYGADAVPGALSGHDGKGPRRGHGHAFWLPEDADSDGLIDHLTVHVPAMDGASLAALLAADIAVRSRRRSWRAEWHWIGKSGDPDAPGTLLGAARAWSSLTPYIGPWHEKRGFSRSDMIRRECDARGLPATRTIEPAAEISGRHSVPRWRWRDSVPPGGAKAGFWHVVFDSPVRGPLALGYGCHFGLGLFLPAGGDG